MKLTLIRTNNGLQAITPHQIDQIKKLREGEEYEVEVKQPRNYEFHKKFFAFVRLCNYHKPEHLDRLINSEEDMLDFIKIGVGHCKTWTTPKGDTAYKPQSISFASMDETDFQEFYDRCVDFCLKYILKGLSKHEIEQELIDFI